MDYAEKFNPHINWDCADQSIFNLVAEDNRLSEDDLYNMIETIK